MADPIKNNYEFEVAGQSDAGQITELVNSVYRGENSKKGWTTEADLLGGIRITEEKIIELINTSGKAILITLFEKKIIGSVFLEEKKDACYLGMLSVDVNFQNSGIGKIIIERCENFAREEFKSKEMTIKVFGARPELISYYQRRGYNITGEKESFTPSDDSIGIPKAKDLYFEILSKKL